MIESNVVAIESKLEYPCMRKTASGKVVLFTDNTTGTVITTGGAQPIGYHSSDWAPETFSTFSGKVELRQS